MKFDVVKGFEISGEIIDMLKGYGIDEDEAIDLGTAIFFRVVDRLGLEPDDSHLEDDLMNIMVEGLFNLI